MTDLLSGKRLLVTGVTNRQSIAFSVAERAQEAGADVVLTSFGRVRRLTERTAELMAEPPDVLELDVTNPEDHARVAEALRTRWGGVDGVVHAVAYAGGDALGGEFLRTDWESVSRSVHVSAFSLKSLTAALEPLLGRGSSIVGLDFDASVAWPIYDWMGVSKSALEAISRYLARDLGPAGVRVNLVSAGVLKTVAARGIPGYRRLADAWEECAPLGWDCSDPTPVADAVCFLLSDWARAMTGEIVHVDGGVHAIGLAGYHDRSPGRDASDGRSAPAVPAPHAGAPVPLAAG